MIPAWDYNQVCRELVRTFGYGGADEPAATVKMVGVLFAPAEVRLAREEIVPGLDYFHHRAGKNIDFFCAGYSRYGFTTG